MSRLKLITAPAAVLVSTADAKTHLRVTQTAENDFIDSLVLAATNLAEQHTGKRFINQTWEMVLDQFPMSANGPWWDGVREGSIEELFRGGQCIEVPIGPLSTITTITTYDAANASTVMSSSLYRADNSGLVPRIVLNDGQSWPTNIRNIGGVEIRFVAGYGATAASVPTPIIVAVKQLITHLFENRGDEGVEIPKTVMRLLEPYQIRRMA